MKVTAVIITYNEEANIAACLDSVAWCDEVVVVDSLSTDATERICREYGVIFHQRTWSGFREQKQYAADRASHDWVLSVDADERVTPQLRDELQAVLADGTGRYAAYAMPRHTFYLGRWIRHGGWYPDYKVRLFNRRCARFNGEDPHDHVEADGPIRKLTGPLHHYTYRDLSHQLKTIDAFSTTRAGKMCARGVRFRIWKMLVRPVIKFAETYLWKRGFLDGLPGLIIAVCTSYYIFLTWAKLWELCRSAGGERR